MGRFKGLLGILILGAAGLATLQAATVLAGVKAGPPVVSMRGITWDDSRVQALEGPWEFYWQELLEPGEFESALVTPVRTRTALRRWAEEGRGDFSPRGFGTYRMLIDFGATPPDLALLPGTISTASAIWWNGELVVRYGEPGTSQESTTAGWRNGIHTLSPLPPGTTTAELVIQVANFADSPSTSFGELPRIGTMDALMSERYRTQGLFFFITGFCLAFGVYHLLRFTFQPKDPSQLFFAGICWSLGLRIMFSDTMPAISLFPHIGWHMAITINYLTYTSLVTFFAAFMASHFKARISKAYTLISFAGSLAYSLIIVFSPPAFFTGVVVWYQLFSILVGAVGIGLLVWAMYRRTRGAVLFFAGFLVMFATAVADIASVLFRLPLPSLSLYGITFFVLLEAVSLSRNAAHLTRTAEELSSKLQVINDSQARFLPRELMQLLGKELVTDLDTNDCTGQQMAILMLDYGITFTSHVDKDVLSSTLNGFHHALGPLVRKHGGFVSHYQAQGMVALFPSGARKALACAYEAVRQGLAGNLRGGSPMNLHCGVHWGSILLGLIGESERMNSAIMSAHVGDVRKLMEKGKSLGALVILSQDALEQLGNTESWQFRKIGTLSLSSGFQSIWDFFDADPAPVWRAKRRTKRILALAIRARGRGQEQEAARLLRQALASYPRDQVVRYHLGKIRSQSARP